MEHHTKKRVVVAEDDAVLRNILLEHLAQNGYDAEGAEDGEAALAILRSRQDTDLVLLDMVMPKKDGMSVLREMRADPALKDTPVIVVSNSGQPVEIEEARALGAKDFLVKTTFDAGDVLEKVNALFA